MSDSNDEMTAGFVELIPEDVPAPASPRSRKNVAKQAARSIALEPHVLVSMAALLDGDENAVTVVTSSLEAAGFLDHLPDGDTHQKAYARLQRYLGYGHRSTGVPDRGSLSWLSFRTQAFTVTD